MSIGKSLVTTYIRPGLALVTAFYVLKLVIILLLYSYIVRGRKLVWNMFFLADIEISSPLAAARVVTVTSSLSSIISP